MHRSARPDFQAITHWITALAASHPVDLPEQLGLRLGVKRPTALKYIRRLVETGWLVKQPNGRRGWRYQPGAFRQVVHTYALPGLSEDVPWAMEFAPYFQLPPAVNRMAQHIFTEILNNAIDHSEGQQATVSVRQTPSHVQLLISDDGRGVFNKISEAFALADPRLAMLELSKGKLTSHPDCHTGRGLFFSSRLADIFDLHANDTAFQRREWELNGNWQEAKPLKNKGTSVFAAIHLETSRTLESTLKQFSLSGTGYGFERTIISMRLLANSVSGLESRAQARRVGARLNQFKRAEVDFQGVNHVGHGFVDELFRVVPSQQPGLSLVPINMGPDVAAMVESVMA
jgi:anti-sigma regulatory factor (Ser/Thr protein kinase)